MLETDITSGSLDKLLIYQALGLPEVWRYDGSVLTVFVLQTSGDYQAVSQSQVFPALDIKAIPQFIRQSLTNGETVTLRTFRDWVRQQATET